MTLILTKNCIQLFKACLRDDGREVCPIGRQHRLRQFDIGRVFFKIGGLVMQEVVTLETAYLQHGIGQISSVLPQNHPRLQRAQFLHEKQGRHQNDRRHRVIPPIQYSCNLQRIKQSATSLLYL